MYKYVIRRLLLSVPVLLLSSLIVFGLMRVMPGDALTALMCESGNVSAKDLQQLQKDLGLDRPYDLRSQPPYLPAKGLLPVDCSHLQPGFLHFPDRADRGGAEESDPRHPRAG